MLLSIKLKIVYFKKIYFKKKGGNMKGGRRAGRGGEEEEEKNGCPWTRGNQSFCFLRRNNKGHFGKTKLPKSSNHFIGIK